MNTTRTLTIASIKMFLRNRQALFFTLFSPLIIMVIFGLIGFDKPPKYDIGIVNDSFNPATTQFVDQLKNFPVFNSHLGEKNDELVALSEGNRVVVFELGATLINPMATTAGPSTVVAYVNEDEPAQAQTVLSVLNQYLDKMTLTLTNAPRLFVVEQRAVNARNLRYFDFLLPGLIALSIMQMSVFSVAFVFAQYKEKGVLKRLLATPMRPYQFVVANVITRLLVAVAQAAIFIALGVFAFKAQILGSYALVLLAVVLGSLMFLGLGFTVSGLSKTVETVPAIANLVVFPMLFLGGTFFPITNMPVWLQHFAKYLPLTFFSGALRDVMTKGATFTDIQGDLGAMLIWAVILIGLATITFGFQEKESG